jgi:hypothetical protein
MNAHDWEFLSVVLESLAFFLVTVELYGEQRLRELHDLLVPFLQRVTLIHERSTDHELVASRTCWEGVAGGGPYRKPSPRKPSRFVASTCHFAAAS